MADLKRNISGSFTLESALILPIVLFALLACVEFAIQIHDRTYLVLISEEVLYHVANTHDQINIEETGTGALITKLANPGLIRKPIQITAEKVASNRILSSETGWEVTADYKDQDFSVFSLLGIRHETDITERVSLKYTDATRFVRLVDFADDVTNEVRVLQPAKATYVETIGKIEKWLEEWL